MFITALLVIAENGKQPLPEMPYSVSWWTFSFLATSNKPTLLKSIRVAKLCLKVFTQMRVSTTIQPEYSLRCTKIFNAIIDTFETPNISSY